MLRTYEEFIEKVNELGFLALSNGFAEGLPALVHITDGKAWHTGDIDTDPWKWKDRAAAGKKLAFGCILGGQKGFVAKWMYPYFYAACHPQTSIEERYAFGEISQTTFTLWKLFQERKELNTDEIRRMMGVSGKSRAGRVDTAVKQLQRQYYITVSGNQRKRSKTGEEYGWPANKYMLVSTWVPDGWLNEADRIMKEDAKEKILDVGIKNGNQANREELSKILFGK